MLNFLEKLPNIFLVFAAFVLLLIVYLINKEADVFQLMNTALGALIGLAMKTAKASPNVAAETVNTKEINVSD